MKINIFIIPLFLILISLGAVFGAGPILLSNVKELHFRAGELTASRRVPPVNQMTCVGGTGQRESHKVTYARCVNTHYGTNNQEPVWRCEIGTFDNVKLGQAWVNCEGYKDSDDPYVLDGSCALEYTLDLHHRREEPMIPQVVNQQNLKPKTPPHIEDNMNFFRIFGLFLGALFGIVIVVILIEASKPKRVTITKSETVIRPVQKSNPTIVSSVQVPVPPVTVHVPPVAPPPPAPTFYTQPYYRSNPSVHTTLHVTNSGITPITSVCSEVTPGLSVCSTFGPSVSKQRSCQSANSPVTSSVSSSLMSNSGGDSRSWSLKKVLAETKRR